MFTFKKKREQTESCSNIICCDSAFAFKEAYNTLTTNVMHLQIDDSCKKIAITSSVYGEDKSSLAINLAISLALNLLDKKVLLVDADMRTPHIKAFLEEVVTEQCDAGLSDFITGGDYKSIFTKSHINNLDIVFSGSSVCNPAGLINSKKMNEFITKCESEYDYIIIDTPPVSVVSDAVSLAGHVNGYIISTKAKFSTVPMLSAAEEALSSVGATVFGVVLA